jgi:hypothetical protein
MKVCAIGLVGLVTAALAPAAMGSAFSASQDNTLYQDGTGSLSSGAGPTMFAGLTSQGSIRRGLVSFDVSSIPAGSTITGVTLTMFMSQTTAGAVNVSLHRVLDSWGEGTSNAGINGGAGAAATASDATWLHRFFNTTLWTTAGGDFDPAVSAVTSVNGIASYTWSSTQMIAEVQAWVDGTQGNFGWLIQGDESTAGSTKRFVTREGTTVSQRPALDITYVPAPASAGVLLGALGMAARRRR